MANKVFDVTELLEAILVELPMKDLLLSQRVSRQFRNTVTASTPIKTALFMLPGTAADVPLEAIRSPRALDEDPRSRRARFGPVPNGGIAINPLLSTYVPVTPHFTKKGDISCSYFFFGSGVVDCNAEASCRRMFITQPPLSVELHVTTGRVPSKSQTETPPQHHIVQRRGGILQDTRHATSLGEFLDWLAPMPRPLSGSRRYVHLMHHAEWSTWHYTKGTEVEYSCRSGHDEVEGMCYVWEDGERKRIRPGSHRVSKEMSALLRGIDFDFARELLKMCGGDIMRKPVASSPVAATKDE